MIIHGKVLLEKSQAPPIKEKKKNAAKDMCIQLLIQHGIDMTPKQVMKKINNLKARIKAKTDRKQTGNRKINLNGPERKFFDLMGGVDNPSVSKRPYGVAVGSSGRQQDTALEEDEGQSAVNEEANNETANISVDQLNRQSDVRQTVNQKTILEEQLNLIKAQQAYTAQLQAQQDERHEKEMELLMLKRKLTLLKIQQLENED
ncbi:uncharacterized protein LOC110681550 [Aedes aegypti]|uniref:Uncharacterized protein n=1 Tax=Aedes aegypti TaxID=7159 RepID=A0A6I8U1P2_AEDAE|nr:uncharacterized protein LOC110676034 [Aedes aegypti]XP_021698877.1 uncharacterized protein LOC110676211 [Aedes aegypti]XP_021713288.1 uncharacterized protein LOC110681547 [Aedes aegypti]XP_021713291.1 uncharacterized protein LOC110681550 [Aedes aegypti]